jgi:transcription initiation factor TFIID subunit 7
MSKPTITLKIGPSNTFNPRISTGGAQTPSSAIPKIKLNLSGSKPSTPSENIRAIPKPVVKTKAGRAPKPSAKVVANKKRPIKAESEDEDDELQANGASAQHQPKRIKLSMGGPKTPVLKAKFKGKPPKRPLGEGYDSEASDREADPLIEEEFILRMVPGPDCDYVREAIQNRLIGVPASQGGANIRMKFLHQDGRRACVTVRGHHYAATLVDLPCIIEGMKSWDKRGWWKSADICQMLWVFAPIEKESDALTIDLPKLIDPQTYQYPHGVTPPMFDARRRRFRKRISRTAIEAVEDAVEKLLEADSKATEIQYEVIEPERRPGHAHGSPDEFDDDEYSEDEDQDAEGEVDDGEGYFSHMNGASHELQQGEADELAADLEADLEAAFNADFEEAGTPYSTAVADTPQTTLPAGTSDATQAMEEESGFDSSDGGDAESIDGEEDVDEDEKARLAQLQGAKEDIAEMERQLQTLQTQLDGQANPILKRRIMDNMGKVKAELMLKKSAIGEGDED